MKKFILSDLHIGHKDAQYDAMDQAIAYIQKEVKQGDEIWGLGGGFPPTLYRETMTMCWKNTGIIQISLILSDQSS